MNTFPTWVPIARETQPIYRDGRDEDERSDGVMDVVKTHPDKVDFNVQTGSLTLSQLATVKAFLAANQGQFIFVHWDGVSYVVAQGKGAYSEQFVSASYRALRLRFVGQ
jgi:ABC-type sugar transport system substrate-binding protein